MFTIQTQNKSIEYHEEIRVRDLVNDSNKMYPIALVNNRMRELSYKFSYDAEVEFLSLDHPETVHIYEASLRFLIAMAFKNVYPEYKIKFKYSVSRSIFCYIVTNGFCDSTIATYGNGRNGRATVRHAQDQGC